MGKGTIYDDPRFEYEDAFSGRTVRRLTDYLGHSNHFYFTDPCFFDEDRSMVFVSERGNASNFFRYDFVDGTITQITDLAQRVRPYACVSDANRALYFWSKGVLIELDLEFRAIILLEQGS